MHLMAIKGMKKIPLESLLDDESCELNEFDAWVVKIKPGKGLGGKVYEFNAGNIDKRARTLSCNEADANWEDEV